MGGCPGQGNVFVQRSGDPLISGDVLVDGRIQRGGSAVGIRVRLIEGGQVLAETVAVEDGFYTFGSISNTTDTRNLTITIDQIPSDIECPITRLNVIVNRGDFLEVVFDCFTSGPTGGVPTTEAVFVKSAITFVTLQM